MSLAWYWYYAYQIGLSRQEARSTLMGHLLDLIACHQIKHEGAKLKREESDEDFFELLKRR